MAGAAASGHRQLRALGLLVAVVSLLLDVMAAALTLPGLIAHPPADVPAGEAETVIGVVIFAFAFPILGWLIVRRQPANRLGWVYLAIGFFESLNVFSRAYSSWAYTSAGGNLPLAAELSWVGIWAWVPAFTLFSTLAILLFPDGHLPSRRWWPALALTVVAFVLLFVPMAIATWPYRGMQLWLANAENLPPPPVPAVQFAFASQAVGQLVLLAAMVGSVAGLVARWRRARGIERLQLKWFAFGAVIDLAILTVWFTNVLGPVAAVFSAIALGLSLPVAIAIAMTRHRLYDIDRLVSRTVSWAAVTGLLAAVFAGAVLGLQQLLDRLTGAGTLAVAGSTLLVFVLFDPLRRRVQRLVDRRFDRSRYDAERTVAGLTARLRDETDLQRVGGEIESTVRQALSPAHVAVWTRDR
jgi:hypothetical protein